MFFESLISIDWKKVIPNCIWIAIALKIAKILVAQVSVQPFKNNQGASAIASKILAPQ